MFIGFVSEKASSIQFPDGFLIFDVCSDVESRGDVLAQPMDNERGKYDPAPVNLLSVGQSS